MSKYAYGFVYVWYDRKRKKYCVGSHHGREDDGYTSSTGHFRQAIKKRPNDFSRRIVARNYYKDCYKETQALEQRWLDMIKLDELGVRYYNLKPFATGGSFAKGCASESARHKMSVAKLGKKTGPRPIEVTLKISKAQTGQKRHKFSNETRERMSVAKKRTYKLKDPNGIIHEFVGLKDFAIEFGLNPSALSRVIKGERPHHNKWTAVE